MNVEAEAPGFLPLARCDAGRESTRERDAECAPAAHKHREAAGARRELEAEAQRAEPLEE